VTVGMFDLSLGMEGKPKALPVLWNSVALWLTSLPEAIYAAALRPDHHVFAIAILIARGTQQR
jgi:hypothetical protein